jgi:hypothetical protein
VTEQATEQAHAPLVPPAAGVVSETHAPVTEDMRRRALNLSNAEVAEALRDLCFAANMPPGEARVGKIAGCMMGLDRAQARLRATVLAP